MIENSLICWSWFSICLHWSGRLWCRHQNPLISFFLVSCFSLKWPTVDEGWSAFLFRGFSGCRMGFHWCLVGTQWLANWLISGYLSCLLNITILKFKYWKSYKILTFLLSSFHVLLVSLPSIGDLGFCFCCNVVSLKLELIINLGRINIFAA